MAKFQHSAWIRDGAMFVRGKDDILTQPQELSGDLLDVFVHSTVQRFPLGSRIIDYTLNRKFVYGKMGATAQLPGKLLQSPVPDTAHEDLAVAAAAVGDTTITVTPATNDATLNQYAGGLLLVDEGAAGLGDIYRVKSHPLISAAAAGVFTLADGETVRRALAAATHKVSLLANPYTGLIVHGSPPTAHVVGVPLASMAASEFGFFQTWGPGPGLIDTTAVIGDELVPSPTVDGAVSPRLLVEGTPNTGAQVVTIGKVMKVGDNTDHGFVFWMIE